MRLRTVGILLFEDVEVLDFAGPFEVFSITKDEGGNSLFEVSIIAKTKDSILARNGLSINPDYSFEDSPRFDIIIVPGGWGTRRLLKDQLTLEWIKKQHETTEITMSVCSGSLLFGKLGLLEEKPYCTHHHAYPEMDAISTTAIPQPDKRYVQTGKIYTSAGISAGIDLAFFILETLYDREMVLRTAGYMEYRLPKEFN